MSNSICIFIASRYIKEQIQDVAVRQIEQGEFKLLDVLHHFTSGMKAICTDLCYNGCD